MSDQSSTVSVGHIVSESGAAAVVIVLEPGKHRLIMTAPGARLVASQLLDWAQHADSWTTKPEDLRKQEWMTMRSPPTAEATWVEVKAEIKVAENPQPENA